MTSKTIILLSAAVFVAAVIFVRPLFSFGQLSPDGTQPSFSADVQAGLQSPDVLAVGADSVMSWDQFGINQVVDGSLPPSFVTKSVVQDILQTVKTEQAYDKEESVSLKVNNLTPEEVQGVEGDVGSDLPPGEIINPSPSVDNNPNVSFSSGEGAVSAEDTSSAPINEQSASSTPGEATSTEAGQSTNATGTDASSTGDTQINDQTIFDVILQGEEVASSSASSTPTDVTPTVPDLTPVDTITPPPADTTPPPTP